MTTDLDQQRLNKDLDITKTKVFLGSNAAFLGPLMCGLAFSWITSIKTACTNGVFLYWNPHWFLSLPLDTRVTVLLHELWHVALLHMLRRGDRHPRVWNWACDIFINDMLRRLGHTFEGTYPWMSDSLNIYRHPTDWISIGDYPENMPVEDIYDALIKLFPEGPPGPVWGFPDGDPTDIIEPEDKRDIEHAIINKVVSAVMAAKLAGHPGDLPGDIEGVLDKFLKPKLPWNVLLHNFFNELYEEDYTLARPDRRYEDIYLPSLQEMEGGLDDIVWFQDVSGSVMDNEIIRFSSEFKFIKDKYNPKRVTIVLFDTIIQKVTVYERDDPFDVLIINGRDGTSFNCVHNYMIKNRPTAAIIFSDMDCTPMQPLPNGMDIPTIWVGVNADSNTKVPFGKLIHIRE